MNNAVRPKTVGVLLAAFLLMPAASLVAQDQQPASPSGAPHWQARPRGTPPRGAAGSATQPEGMPSVGTPGGAAAVHAPPSAVPGKKTPAGEQFFIVASVDLQKSQLLLKYPTEVTQLVKVDGSTKFADQSGQPLKLSDFRAGDTVWVISRTIGGELTAVSVRKGVMDLADLHRYYLNYAEVK